MKSLRRGVLRAALGTAAAIALLSLQGCVFFIPNSIRAISELRSVQEQSLQSDSVVPEVDVILNAAGGDAIDVYLPDQASKRFRIAEAAAALLGANGTPVLANDFEPDTATVQLDRRLSTRTGDTWTLTLDTTSLQAIVRDQGYEGFDLFICHPGVETRFDAPGPDYPEGEAPCLRGVGWIVDGTPLSITATMLPDVADYMRFIAGGLLGLVLFGSLAWFIGEQLRRGPFRRRSAGAVALGLIAGLNLAVGGVVAAAAIAAAAGPADNLALAKDLGVGLFALSIALPAMAATAPGVIFATKLVRRRPWPDEPPATKFHAWPAPPPPGALGGPPAPPALPLR